MDIDQLKSEWQQQKAEAPTELSENSSLMTRLKKLQSKMVFTNLKVSVFQGASLVIIGLVWHYFQEGRSWAFHGSILSIALIIMVMVGIHWSRTLFWKQPDFSADSKHFLHTTIKRLQRTIWITKVVSPVYTVLLYAGLCLYFYDILQGGSLTMILLIVGGTTVYVILASYFGYKHHRRKQKKEVEPLINELKEVLEGLG